jgi:hypothetical protein
VEALEDLELQLPLMVLQQDLLVVVEVEQEFVVVLQIILNFQTVGQLLLEQDKLIH